MIDDELDDGAVLSEVRESFSRLPLVPAPALEVITARGRARRRRRAGLSMAGAGACAALAAGLVAGPGLAGPSSPHDASRLTAFTITSGPDGSTILILNPEQFFDPPTLRKALADHGIPALITFNKACVSPHPANLGAIPGSRKDWKFLIYGSKIPAGHELSIAYFKVGFKGGWSTRVKASLIDANAKITCTP
jgi:hypothetical protein